jgi:hypothetical protein
MRRNKQTKALRHALQALHHAPRKQIPQYFRLACELAWITMRRHFATTPKGGINNFNLLFAKARVAGLITSPAQWMRYLEISSRLSESTDAKTLALLFEQLPGFLADSLELLSQLDRHSSEP